MLRNVLTPRLASALMLSAAAVTAPAVASAQDWTGFYYGLNVGGGSSSVRWHDLVVPSNTGQGLPGGTVFSATEGGFVGGIQLGYNQQMGPWVWGVEALFDGAGNSVSSDCFGGYGDYHATCGSRTNWILDFTGRVGGTVGPALLFVRGGGQLNGETAFAKNVSDFGTFLGGYKSVHDTPFGYIFGVGAEVAFTDDVSGTIEYDYSSVDFTAHFAQGTGPEATNLHPFHVDVTHQASIVTARLNFKLD